MSVVIIISVAVWTPFFVKIGGGLRFVGKDNHLDPAFDLINISLI